MIYDPDLKRGVKKKDLGSTCQNPTRVEVNSDSSMESLFELASSLFFNKLSSTIEEYNLADSSGVEIHVANKDDWTIGSYYQNHGFVPSKHKFYIMAVLKVIVQF